MAIPITCAGCNAAFEVPDTLAGKTIRCTSCKAQMTVPESLDSLEPIEPVEPVAQTAVSPNGQASASETKKPFGFGSGSQTAAKPAPAASALSLDDEPAATKTSPNGKASAPPKPSAPKTEAKSAPAKPASKAAAVVEVDEDDEDEKDEKSKTTKSKTGDKKSATFKGSPKKRRDDDDDDDDDEKPTRKKNKSGGSGMMIGIIAAGAIGLAAIAGILIYALSGDDKKDTAKKDDSKPGTSSPAGSTPPAGAPGPGGMSPGPGGMSPGPGGMSPGPGGMSPGPGGMPPGPGGVGLPGPGGVGLPGPGGMSPGPGGVGLPGPGGIGLPGPGGMSPGPGGVGLPGPGGMFPGPGGMFPGPGGGPGGAPGGNPFGGNPLGGLGKIDQLGTPGAWTSFKGDGFTADFPGTPDVKSENVQNLTLKITAIITKTEAAVGAIHMTLPVALGDSKQMLTLFMEGFSKSAKFKDKTVTDTTVDGHPAKEVDLTDKEGEGKLRVVVVKNRVYLFLAGGPHQAGKPAMAKADVDRFLNSVKITYNGGDVVAGGPGLPGPGGMFPGPGGMFPGPGGVGPGPGGMFPGPGGVGPGPGGIGPGGVGPGPGTGIGGGDPGNFDGNMKARIDAFYTAVFDPEKQELFAIEYRVGTNNRVQGALQRYDATKFNPLGKYNLAHLGFRAVIDPQAELLYLAFATAPNAALAAMQTDRASAVGDIAVYDLKAMRDGKNGDGKPLEVGKDLKPVATITIKSLIQGMELSPDGKSLYLLVTTGTTKRVSSILLIDTAKRAEVKEKRRELTELARDMVKAGDGKNLLVIEELKAKTKASAVVVFDTTAWAPVKTAALRDGPTLDVAALSGGGGVVSVLPTNQPAGGAPGGPGGLPGPGGGPGGLPGGFPGPGGVGPGGFPGPGGVGPGGPGGPPRPGGGGPGGIGGPGAGGNQPQMHFQLHLIDADGGTTVEMDLGATARSANGGYVAFDPANKKLFVSSWHGSGLDVYEVTDSKAANGVKLKSSIRTVRKAPVGGHFIMSPDGKFLVFHDGLVVDTDNIGGKLPTPGAPRVVLLVAFRALVSPVALLVVFLALASPVALLAEFRRCRVLPGPGLPGMPPGGIVPPGGPGGKPPMPGAPPAPGGANPAAPGAPLPGGAPGLPGMPPGAGVPPMPGASPMPGAPGKPGPGKPGPGGAAPGFPGG